MHETFSSWPLLYLATLFPTAALVSGVFSANVTADIEIISINVFYDTNVKSAAPVLSKVYLVAGKRHQCGIPTWKRECWHNHNPYECYMFRFLHYELLSRIKDTFVLNEIIIINLEKC